MSFDATSLAPALLMTSASAPELLPAELAVLLDGAQAQQWHQQPLHPTQQNRMAQRLGQRMAESRLREAGMLTRRARRIARHTLAPGVQACVLYQGDGQRPSEPCWVVWADLAPGSQWQAPSPPQGQCSEWLVMAGAVQLHNSPVAGPPLTLTVRDYHRCGAGQPAPCWHSPGGARLFLRQSWVQADSDTAQLTLHDAQAGWQDFGPLIRRRVLWSGHGQAALLYHALPGAVVPRHRHGHDEECLMLSGELFLDDLLLCEGDYQLAPAGTGHQLTTTDTGVVIYAHGDLDLQFEP